MEVEEVGVEQEDGAIEESRLRPLDYPIPNRTVRDSELPGDSSGRQAKVWPYETPNRPLPKLSEDEPVELVQTEPFYRANWTFILLIFQFCTSYPSARSYRRFKRW